MNIDFSNGLFTNTKPINTPEGFYPDASNMRASGKSRRSEEGTIIMGVPINIIQWGNCAVGNKTVILGQLEDGNNVKLGSIIGILDTDDNWITIINRALPDKLGITQPVQVEGRKDWKGDTLIYFATPTGARRINLDTYDPLVSDEIFDKTTNLFLEYQLPITIYEGEVNTGEVPSGVYQAAARLVTDSGAATVFGIMSNVVPIVPSSIDAYRDSVDGAPPQTPTVKAIEFTVDNVDTTFKWIEIAILTYIGLANTPAVYLMNKILINGASTLNITYRGASDNAETLTLDELIVSGVAYQTGEYLAQKDGTLLIASPKEAEMPPIDWNRVADGIQAEYIIKDIHYSEILKFEYDDNNDSNETYKVLNVKETSTPPMDQGYHNPATCYSFKGYRRNEAYAFTMTPIFISGLQGPTVQIPARDSVDTPATKEGPVITVPTFVHLTGLAPGSYGNWSVVTVTASGNSDQSTPPLGVKLIGGPDPPTNLVVDEVTTIGYTLSWDAAIPDTNGSVIAEYWVFVNLDNARQLVGKVIGNPPLLTFTGTFVVSAPGYSGQYYVIAVDSSAFQSEPSNEVTITIPGAAAAANPVVSLVEPPTSLVASTIGTTSFTLSWDPSVAPNVIGYWIYLSQFVYASVGSAGTGAEGGRLGTKVSEEVYDDRYPSIAEGEGIRLHQFPTAELEPIIKGNVEDGSLYMRVLGVKFSGIRLNVTELQYENQIAGIIIGRVNRKGQETQLAQGIVRPTCFVQNMEDNTSFKSILLGDGTVDWENFGDKKPIFGDPSEDDFRYDSSTPIWNSVHFISPDIIHGLHTIYQGNYIQQHSLYTCNPILMKNEYAVVGVPGRDEASRSSTYFKNITGIHSDGANLDQTRIHLDGTPRLVGPFGVPLMNGARGGRINVSLSLTGDSIEMCSSDGFAWLKTLNGIDIPNYVKDVFNLPYFITTKRLYGDNTTTRESWLFNPFLENAPEIPFVLYSTVRDNPKQYGPLDQMVGMFTHYMEWGTSDVAFFNGDTFINKYGLSINDEAYLPFGNDDEAQSPHQLIGHTKPSNASCVVNMWVESFNNYAYRHYEEPVSFAPDSIDNAQGTTPYYPKYKQLVNDNQPMGILSMAAANWVRAGYASQYNNQYSAQPTIMPYPVTPKEDIEDLAHLVNRIIYSDTVVQGEKNDAYQLFLPNNYYDVPQEYGELTDIYVNRELFASTNQIQWKLFYNTLVTQATSAGTVVLGSGGAFNRPGVPMQTVDGGFAGTSHWVHATNSTYGRVFVDKLQGRIFLLTDQLQDISLSLIDDGRLVIQDIPDLDMLIGSEPLHDRVLIRLGSEMYSYNFLRKAFISRHTYLPRWMFSHSAYLYSNNVDITENKLEGIFKHGLGLTAEFYGVKKESSITLVSNVEATQSKLFRVLELITTMEDEAGLSIPFSTFTQLAIWNDERNTGLLDIVRQTDAFQQPGIMEVLQNKVRDEFRLVVPRDIVLDPNISIFDISNHAQIRGDTIPALWLPKIRGNFIQIKLITDNALGPIFVYRVGVEAAKNIR